MTSYNLHILHITFQSTHLIYVFRFKKEIGIEQRRNRIVAFKLCTTKSYWFGKGVGELPTST